jgi:hypothetical protein
MRGCGGHRRKPASSGGPCRASRKGPPRTPWLTRTDAPGRLVDRQEIAWKLAAAMSFYYRHRHRGGWAATHHIGLDYAHARDRQPPAWMLNYLGMAYGVQHMAEPVGCFEQALAIYRELGDERGSSPGPRRH